MKKLICLLLSMIMMMSTGVFTACNNTPDDGSNVPGEITQEQLIKHYEELSADYDKNYIHALTEHGTEIAHYASSRMDLNKESGKNYYSALEQFTDTESADEFMREKIKEYDKHIEDYCKDRELRERLTTILSEQTTVESENFSLRFGSWGTAISSSGRAVNHLKVSSTCENVTYTCRAWENVMFYKQGKSNGFSKASEPMSAGDVLSFEYTGISPFYGDEMWWQNYDRYYIKRAGYFDITVQGDAGYLGYAVVKVYFDPGSFRNLQSKDFYYEILDIVSYKIRDDGQTHMTNPEMKTYDIILQDAMI